MTKRLVVATRNVRKAGEMHSTLEELLSGWQILALSDFPDFPEPAEVCETYAGNATLKAEVASRALGEVCISDDAGLEVEAFWGAPGIYSKRFIGEETSFEEKMKAILAGLEKVPAASRRARFVCVVAIAGPGMDTRSFRAEKEGLIAAAPVGAGGFGYDPLFFLPELGKTYAELEPAHKNRISHRGLVLREAAKWLLSC